MKFLQHDRWDDTYSYDYSIFRHNYISMYHKYDDGLRSWSNHKHDVVISGHGERYQSVHVHKHQYYNKPNGIVNTWACMLLDSINAN